MDKQEENTSIHIRWRAFEDKYNISMNDVIEIPNYFRHVCRLYIHKKDLERWNMHKQLGHELKTKQYLDMEMKYAEQNKRFSEMHNIPFDDETHPHMIEPITIYDCSFSLKDVESKPFMSETSDCSWSAMTYTHYWENTQPSC